VALYPLPYSIPFADGGYGLAALAPTAVLYRFAGAGMVPIGENALAVFAPVFIGPGIRMLVSAPARPPPPPPPPVPPPGLEAAASSPARRPR
jgi:hypothetical protein